MLAMSKNNTLVLYFMAVETFEDEVGNIISVDGDRALYRRNVPEDLLAEGAVLSINDFHDGAATAGTTPAVGTRVFKEVLGNLSEPVDPFNQVWRLHAKTLPSRAFESTQLRLPCFYVITQALFDHYAETTNEELERLYAAKGSMVVKAVLFDYLDEEVFSI